MPPAPAQRPSPAGVGRRRPARRRSAALVLDFEQPLPWAGSASTLGVRAAPARAGSRTPRAQRVSPRRLRPRGFDDAVALAFSRLTRRSTGARVARASPSHTQASPKARANEAAIHSGHIGAQVSGGVRRETTGASGGFVRRERRWRVLRAVDVGRQFLRCDAPALRAATPARRRAAYQTHDSGSGGASAQHVEHQIADRGPVAGAAKRWALPQSGQSLRRRTMPCTDVGDDLDVAARCGHPFSSSSLRSRGRREAPHMATSAAKPTSQPALPRQRTMLLPR